MSVVYDRESVVKVILDLKRKKEYKAARLMTALYQDLKSYQRNSEKAEGRLADIGIPGYGW